jgi:hypothetical protein
LPFTTRPTGSLEAKVVNVAHPQRVGPVAGEHLEAPRVAFDLDDGVDARAVEPKLEATGTREETDRTH